VPPTPSSAEVKERVGLHGLHLSPYRLAQSFSLLPTTSVPLFFAPTNILAATLETPAGVKVGLDARHLLAKVSGILGCVRLSIRRDRM